MKTYELFFNRMGYPAMKLDKLNQVLKDAVKNSAAKNYHGGLENAYPLPDPNQRIIEIIKEEGLFSFQSEEEAKDDNDFIKTAILSKYPTAAICMSLNDKLSPGQVSFLVDLHRNQGVDLQIYL